MEMTAFCPVQGRKEKYGWKMKRKEEKFMMRDFPTPSKLHLFSWYK